MIKTFAADIMWQLCSAWNVHIHMLVTDKCIEQWLRALDNHVNITLMKLLTITIDSCIRFVELTEMSYHGLVCMYVMLDSLVHVMCM